MTSKRQPSLQEGDSDSIDQAIADVSAAIELHAADKPAPYSGPLLLKVLGELGRMKREPDFQPDYPRALRDGDGHQSDLETQLLALAEMRRRGGLQ